MTLDLAAACLLPGFDGLEASDELLGWVERGLGAAIAVVMVAIMLVVTFFYIREMVRIGEVKR